MRIWFGKYQGKELSDIPSDYLVWLVGDLEDEIDKKQKLMDAIEEILASSDIGKGVI